MSKILVDCTIQGSGGSVTYYKNLINRIAKFDTTREYVFLVNSNLQNCFSSEVLDRSIIIEGKLLKGLRRYLWLRQNLKQICKEQDAKFVFVPYQMSSSLTVPQVLMLRNMEPFGYERYDYNLKEKLRNKVLKTLTIRSLNKSVKILAVSHFVKDFLVTEQGIDPSKIQVIHHGIEDDFDKVENTKNYVSNAGVEGSYFLTSGSFRPYRRYEDVIRAFELYKKNTKDDTSLVIAGKGIPKYQNFIDSLIETSPYRKDIRVLGFVDKQTMISLYKECSVYIASTEIEACPNIAIESLKSGCLVVSANTPPLAEIYGDAALYYKQRDVNQLYLKLIKLMTSNNRNSMSLNATLRSQEFSWEKCAKSTHAFLTGIKI